MSIQIATYPKRRSHPQDKNHGDSLFSLGKRSCESIQSKNLSTRSPHKQLKTDHRRLGAQPISAAHNDYNIQNRAQNEQRAQADRKIGKKETFSSQSTKATIRIRNHVAADNSLSAQSSTAPKLYQHLSVLSVDPKCYDSTLSLRGLNTELNKQLSLTLAEFERSLEKLKKSAVKVLKKEAKSEFAGKRWGKAGKRQRERQYGAEMEFLRESQVKEWNLGVCLPSEAVETRYDRSVSARVRGAASARDVLDGGRDGSRVRTTFDGIDLKKVASWPLCKPEHVHSTNSPDFDLLAGQLLKTHPRTTNPTPKKSVHSHVDLIDPKNALAKEFLNLNKKTMNITGYLENQATEKITQEAEDVVPSYFDESASNHFETVSQSCKSMKRMFSPDPFSGEIGSLMDKVDCDEDSVFWQATDWLCRNDHYDPSLDMCTDAENFFGGVWAEGAGIGAYDSERSCPAIASRLKK